MFFIIKLIKNKNITLIVIINTALLDIFFITTLILLDFYHFDNVKVIFVESDVNFISVS